MIYSRVDLYRPLSSYLQKQKLYIWSGQRLTGFPKQALVFMCLQYKSFDTLWGKEKLLVTSNFSFSHGVSTLLETSLPFSSNQRLLSANSFSLDESNLLFGKGLTKMCSLHEF